MGLIERSFSAETVAKAEIKSLHWQDVDTIYTEFNGNIDNANIKAAAAIAASKLSLVDIATAVRFNNNVALQWENSGGTARNILNVDGSNLVEYGSALDGANTGDFFEWQDLNGDSLAKIEVTGTFNNLQARGSNGKDGRVQAYDAANAKVIDMTHDGTHGTVRTDAGSLILNPFGDVVRSDTDNTVTLGTSGNKWSDVQSTLINGADYGFANGWILREYPCTYDDVQTKSNAWMEKNAHKGIQVLNTDSELVCVIGMNGVIYANDFRSLDKLKELDG